MLERHVDDVIAAYLRLRKRDPADARAVERVEHALGLELPPDLKEISKVFRGGKLGEVTHYEIAPDGRDSVVERTLTARRQLKLNAKYLVLAEPRGRFVFLDATKPRHYRVWSVSALDKGAVAPGIGLGVDFNKHELHAYPNYATFFGELVDDAEKAGQRKQILAANPAPRNLTQLRHRWDPSEVERISQMLRQGRADWHRVSTVRVDGRTLLDLRGITTRGPVFGHRGEPEESWPILRDMDFSGCLVDRPAGSYADVAAEGCRFVGGDFLQQLSGRFVRCDFSRMKLHNGWTKGRFVECRFVGADLRRAILGDHFERCDFTGADLEAAEFDGVFTDCRWDACKTGFGTAPPG